MKSKAFSLIVAACMCVSFGASAKADAWQPSAEIKMAVAGMKNAVANVKYMRARVIWTNHLPSQISDFMDMMKENEPKPYGGNSGPSITKIDTLWQIAGADVYSKTVSFADGDAKSNTVTMWKKNGMRYQSSLLWSGKKVEGKRHLFVEGWIAPISKVKSPADLFRDRITNTPLQLAFNNALADSFLQKDTKATFKGYIDIDGNKCMKIETHPAKGALHTWWINVNHGFMIYRSEKVNRRDGMIVTKSELQASNLVKYGKTWLPQKIETKIDWNDTMSWLRKMNPAALPASLKDANVVTPPQLQEYTVQDVTIGDKTIPPIIWPIGTNLWFKGSNESVTIAAVSQKELAQLNLDRKTHTLPALREYPIGAQKPGTIGVALNDSESKQLKKWRTNDVS